MVDVGCGIGGSSRYISRKWVTTCRVTHPTTSRARAALGHFHARRHVSPHAFCPRAQLGEAHVCAGRERGKGGGRMHVGNSYVVGQERRPEGGQGLLLDSQVCRGRTVTFFPGRPHIVVAWQPGAGGARRGWPAGAGPGRAAGVAGLSAGSGPSAGAGLSAGTGPGLGAGGT